MNINKKLDQNDPKLEELKLNLNNLKNQIKADIGGQDETMDKVYRSIESVFNYVDYRLEYQREEISALWNKYYTHLEGHLPAIKSAGKLEDALKKLGIAEDYQIVKPTIFASKNGSKTFVV